MNSYNKILNLIENGDLENAKIFIKKLENKLFEENSERNRGILMDEINKLKKEYIIKKDIFYGIQENITDNKNFNIESVNLNNNFLYKNDLKNDTFIFRIFDEIKLENCENITIKSAIAKQSILIINVKNSTICCKAQQIRLINCHNLKMKIFSETGIFLQESSGIEISSNNEFNSIKNNYNFVKDFSSPFSSKNYRIIDN